jgi:hypothetical protein
MRVFENRVLRGRKWWEAREEGFYPSPDIIRLIKSRRMMGRACSTQGEIRNAYNILVGKSECQ